MINIEECTGVYGIYVNGQLVYIGKTTQGFGKRYKQHKHYIEFPNDSESQYDMYAELAAELARGSFIQLRPLIIAETIQYKSLYGLTNRDLESMEFALITMLQPRYNVEGRRKPYRYTN